MSKSVAEVRKLEGGTYASAQALYVGVMQGIPNSAGIGPGTSVTVAVIFEGVRSDGNSGSDLPSNYTVIVGPNQDATWYVTKLVGGFEVTLTPRLASMTLAEGTFDVAVFA